MKKVMVGLFLCTAAHALPPQGLQGLDGSPVKLEHAKNKELVVYWATWCSTCKDKLDVILPEINKRPDVAVVTINVDEDVGRAADYMKRNHIELPVLRDAEGTLTKKLGVNVVPHWAVFSKKGAEWVLIDTASAFESARVEKALRQ
jgi:thiol-disulfide isomerase/thioredoxin